MAQGYSGLTIDKTAGEAVAFGDPVYENTDGKVYKADAADVAKLPAAGVIVVGGAMGATVTMLIHGTIKDTVNFAFSVGFPVYVQNGGGLGGGTGDQPQAIGICHPTVSTVQVLVVAPAPVSIIGLSYARFDVDGIASQASGATVTMPFTNFNVQSGNDLELDGMDTTIIRVLTTGVYTLAGPTGNFGHGLSFTAARAAAFQGWNIGDGIEWTTSHVQEEVTLNNGCYLPMNTGPQLCSAGDAIQLSLTVLTSDASNWDWNETGRYYIYRLA